MTTLLSFDKAMRRNLPQNVTTEKTRHGKRVYYYRVGKGTRTRLPDILSDQFQAALAAAQANKPFNLVNRSRSAPVGSLRFVIAKYRQDTSFTSLAPITRKNRNAIFESICIKSGHVPIAKITRQHIVDGRNKRNSGAGHAANAYLKALRPLFIFALGEGYISANPCDGIKKVKTARGGYHTWNVGEIERFEKRHPLGTMANLAIRLLCYTGARRADAMRLGTQNVKNNILEFCPSKTRDKTGVIVTIPILPPLKEAIEATQTGDLVFLTTSHGLPFQSAASFGNWFADRCVEAEVPGRAHGLRKAGATLAAENGASANQLMAMFGWSTIAQAELYTRAADRRKLAFQGAELLLRKSKK